MRQLWSRKQMHSVSKRKHYNFIHQNIYDPRCHRLNPISCSTKTTCSITVLINLCNTLFISFNRYLIIVKYAINTPWKKYYTIDHLRLKNTDKNTLQSAYAADCLKSVCSISTSNFKPMLVDVYFLKGIYPSLQCHWLI